MPALLDALRDSVWVGIGSIGTLAAVIVALGAIALDRRGRRSEAQRLQARSVSGWVTGVQHAEPANDDGGPVPGVTIARLVNASEEPVYQVVVWLVLYPGAPSTGEEAARNYGVGGDPPTVIGVLPPGTFRIYLPDFEPGMHKRPVVEIAFTDAAGLHWLRRQDGRLRRLRETPLRHYKLVEPIEWTEVVPD